MKSFASNEGTHGAEKISHVTKGEANVATPLENKCILMKPYRAARNGEFTLPFRYLSANGNLLK